VHSVHLAQVVLERKWEVRNGFGKKNPANFIILWQYSVEKDSQIPAVIDQ